MILVCLSHAFQKCPVLFFQFKQLIHGLLPWLWLITCLVTDTSFTDLGENSAIHCSLITSQNLLIHSYTQLHMKCLSYPFQNYKHVLFLKFAASKSIPKIHCIFSFHTKNLRQKNPVGKSSGIPPIGSAPTCKKNYWKGGDLELLTHCYWGLGLLSHPFKY